MLVLDTWVAFDFYKSFLAWYCGWYKPTYLEIGCLGGDLCASLSTQRATGVDINLHPDWNTYMQRHSHVTFKHMSSDDFFVQNTDKYGLIFIDGDHDATQVLKDTYSALDCLEEDGLIVLHDTWPPDRGHTAANLCGTAYMAAKALRRRPILEVYTFPVTFGVTLVGRVGTGFPWT